MVALITFVGWHDSGKTTLVTRIVGELVALGYRVAVIKSTSDAGIAFDTPGTDTFKHKMAGAESVMLVAPDQMVLQTKNRGLSLRALAHQYFPDVDLVGGEGFKTEEGIAKIEVRRNRDRPLHSRVDGVVAVATDLEGLSGENVFRLDAPRELAFFIEKHYLKGL